MHIESAHQAELLFFLYGAPSKTTLVAHCVDMLLACAAHYHHGQDVISCVQVMNLTYVFFLTVAQVPKIVLICLLYQFAHATQSA